MGGEGAPPDELEDGTGPTTIGIRTEAGIVESGVAAGVGAPVGGEACEAVTVTLPVA